MKGKSIKPGVYSLKSLIKLINIEGLITLKREKKLNNIIKNTEKLQILKILCEHLEHFHANELVINR